MNGKCLKIRVGLNHAISFVHLMFALLIIVPSAQAARVHVLIVGDTLDPTVGHDVERDIDGMNRLFILLGDHGADKRLIQPITLTDNDCNPVSILRSLDNLKTQPDDTVVFYYSGHGARDEKHGDFIDIPRLQNKGKLLRSAIQGRFSQWLETRQIRLGIIITEMCNQLTILPPVAFVAPSAQGPWIRKLIFESLFIYSSGLLDINSADINQIALDIPPETTDDKRFTTGYHGAIFTQSYCEFISNHIGDLLNWDVVLNGVQDKMKQIFNEHFPNGVVTPNNIRQTTQTIKRISIPRTEIPPILRDGIYLQDIGVLFARQPVRVNTGNRIRFGVKIISIDGNSPVHGDWHADDIILSINGQETANVNQLRSEIDNVEKETFGAWWKASIRDVVRMEPIHFGERKQMIKLMQTSKEKRIKLGVTPYRDIYRVKTDKGPRNGIMIESIISESPAANSTLQKGDIILEINNTPTPTLDDFYKAISDATDVIRIKGYNYRNQTVENFQPIYLNMFPRSSK
jgi:hypothetical protein